MFCFEINSVKFYLISRSKNGFLRVAHFLGFYLFTRLKIIKMIQTLMSVQPEITIVLTMLIVPTLLAVLPVPVKLVSPATDTHVLT